LNEKENLEMAALTRKPSLFAATLDRLGSDIARCAFANGMLPREQDLCTDLGVSRTVVREVVRVLSHKGMLHAQQKIGLRVLPRSSWNLMDFDVLDWIWRTGTHQDYIRDFLEFRLTFEPMASYQAALRASSDAKAALLERCAELLAANKRLQAGTGSREQAIECDIAFHTAIFAASGNHLSRYLGQLVTHMLRRQIDATTDPPDLFSRGLHLHVAVAEAIKAGQAQEAFDRSHELVKMPLDIYTERLVLTLLPAS
jgi:DNA-binding FadR family transcriptional regulator